MAHTTTRTLASPRDFNDEHVRQLLDQRAMRADLHRDGRWDSMSEFSDSPSIYSRAVFSPAANDLGGSSPGLQTPRTHRERFDDPSASMLDLDDDPCSSRDSSVNYDDDKTVSEHDSDEPVPRMSYLGPKMRFHSRAPWEMDGETLEEAEEEEEEEEPEEPPSRKALFSGQRHDQPRPSIDSTRSGKVKKSFDSTSSSSTSNQRGALYALAQAGMSSTSLAAPNAMNTGPSALRNMFAISRSPSRGSEDSRSNSPPDASGMPTPRHLNTSYERAAPRSQTNRQMRPDTLISNDSASTLDSYSEDRHPYAHPYAHPDVVPKPKTPPRHPSPPHGPQPQSTSAPRPSIAVVTDNHAMSVERSRAMTSSPAPSRSPAMGRARSSTFQGKEISSPIPLQRDVPPLPNQSFDAKLLPVASLPSASSDGFGWPESSPAPAFRLISLEEAQTNQRTRSNTVHGSAGGTPTDGPSPASIPFPQSEEPHVLDQFQLRNRARSTSTGSRARQALHTMVTPTKGDLPDPPNVPAAKQLKHKRSGFMRIFNGGKEKDEKPPPVPTLAEGYASFNSQQSSTQPKQPTPKIARVPVPQLSPTLSDGDRLSSNTLTVSGRGPTKRSPPPLSINTQRSPSVTQEHVRFVPPALRYDAPLSAPPNLNEFPSPLKLRPMSTLFSSLGEHISHDGEEPDSGSLSPNTIVSPITPVSGRDPVPSVMGDDQSAVIRALQEQIIGAKKAWQRHVWELEGQVRDLKAEVEELRVAEAEAPYCQACGRGKPKEDTSHTKTSVVNRPRARTGIAASRFGGTSDYD